VGLRTGHGFGSLPLRPRGDRTCGALTSENMPVICFAQSRIGWAGRGAAQKRWMNCHVGWRLPFSD
jgi:hypothetical protein